MTLPLIHSINTADDKNKRWLINSIKKHNRDKKRVKEVIAYVKQNGGLDYAVKSMYEYKYEALKILNTYPDSEYKSSLQLMVDYVIDREK